MKCKPYIRRPLTLRTPRINNRLLNFISEHNHPSCREHTSPSPAQPDPVVRILLIPVHDAAKWSEEVECPPAHTAYA